MANEIRREKPQNFDHPTGSIHAREGRERKFNWPMRTTKGATQAQGTVRKACSRRNSKIRPSSPIRKNSTPANKRCKYRESTLPPQIKVCERDGGGRSS